MKRSAELTALSREHHQSLRLARKCLDTAASGDRQQCMALCAEIVSIFDQEWDRHFLNEEATIFDITRSMSGKIHELGVQLVEEHQQMREMAAKMEQCDCTSLSAFGALLKAHTRMEERELFPLLEEQFSSEQLAVIMAQT